MIVIPDHHSNIPHVHTASIWWQQPAHSNCAGADPAEQGARGRQRDREDQAYRDGEQRWKAGRPAL